LEEWTTPSIKIIRYYDLSPFLFFHSTKAVVLSFHDTGCGPIFPVGTFSHPSGIRFGSWTNQRRDHQILSTSDEFGLKDPYPLVYSKLYSLILLNRKRLTSAFAALSGVG
jgi:hypothetical protein